LPLPQPRRRTVIVGDDEYLHLISFSSDRYSVSPTKYWPRNDLLFKETTAQLSACFAGQLRQFDLNLYVDGTAFQIKVWNALCDIPFGETVTYKEIADRIGNPTACRAVGAANGANRLPIIIPCHRVIGTNTSLTGFGGGIENKNFLIAHERNNSSSSFA